MVFLVASLHLFLVVSSFFLMGDWNCHWLPKPAVIAHIVLYVHGKYLK